MHRPATSDPEPRARTAPRSAPLHALLVPFGSHGDVHPFLALGRALRARGHRVTLLINGYFGPLVRRLGFAAAPPG
jgi:rhamnosyltransferase subunit B